MRELFEQVGLLLQARCLGAEVSRAGWTLQVRTAGEGWALPTLGVPAGVSLPGTRDEGFHPLHPAAWQDGDGSPGAACGFAPHP